MDGLGDLTSDNLIINVVAILLVAYGIHRQNDSYKEKAVTLLLALKAENNKIVREWIKLGIKPKNAFESQALIELFNDFCTTKNCLNCQIGVKILGK